MAVLGVIGGSGLYELNGLEIQGTHLLETPWGQPSAAITEGRLDGQAVYFLPRHGAGHTLLPSEVPYAANIYALRQLGVDSILSLSAVGSLREDLGPGDIMVPDQFIDRTWKRQTTFFGDGIVGHVSAADPICPALAGLAAQVSKSVHPQTLHKGTYLCMEGPQFSTRAESELYRSWGCDIIGMTNGTEARLAREAAICYATVCFVTDYDCWKTDEEPVSVEQVIEVLNANVEKGRRILTGLIAEFPPNNSCQCAQANQWAVITNPDYQPAGRKRELDVLLASRL